MKKNFKNNASRYGYYFGICCKVAGLIAAIESAVIIAAGFGDGDKTVKTLGFILFAINVVIAGYGFWRIK